MAMQAFEIKDFGVEYENFTKKLSLNKKAFQKFTSYFMSEITYGTQHYQDLITKSKDDMKKLQQKIEGIREDINSVHGDKDRAGREIQSLKQDLEDITMAINEKTQDRDVLKEKLTEVEQSVKEKEQRVEESEQKNQECMSNIECGAQLFRTHLGLDIKRTNHDTLVFIFTQVNRSKPDKEYMLELTLAGENYRLLNSDPELSNLQELEDRLNATNNFSGFIVLIRKLFQKMEK